MLQTENSRITEFAPLVSPRWLKSKMPANDETLELVLKSRQTIRDLLSGRDRHRLMVVVGPCSMHDPDAAYDYAARLAALARELEEHLFVVMRTYFEKPRTVVGWKGMISDPNLDGSCDIEAGLTLARKILLRVGALGLPCGTEFLDTVVPQYVSDLVSWVAIGARTTESQIHRQLVSGLSMPVGFKNSTDGSLQNALNALLSARHSHAFLGINADGMTSVVRTTGNQDGHVVLRGGAGGTNYHAEDIASAVGLVKKEGLERGVLVDCSHDNSGKDHTRQAAVFEDVVRTYVDGQRGILGLMLESNLEPGKQTWSEGKKLSYGVSITDACIGWDETAHALKEAAARVAKTS